MIMSDKNSNGPQFSKITVVCCLIFSAIGIIGTLIAAVYFALDPTVAATAITTCGCVGITGQVWNLKKSQAENTIKIYLSAYKEIINMKKENNEDVNDIIYELENNTINKVNETVDNHMFDATSILERQDVL